jgi:hypothetical protein
MASLQFVGGTMRIMYKDRLQVVIKTVTACITSASKYSAHQNPLVCKSVTY